MFELAFQLASQQEFDALPALKTSTGNSTVDAYFEAWALVEHGFAHRAERLLREAEPQPRSTAPEFEAEARWRYLRAMALAMLGESEQALLLFRQSSDRDAGMTLPGEERLNLAMNSSLAQPKRRGKGKGKGTGKGKKGRPNRGGRGPRCASGAGGRTRAQPSQPSRGSWFSSRITQVVLEPSVGCEVASRNNPWA